MRILHVHAGVAGVVSHQPVMKQETGAETRLLHCQARSESVEKLTCSTSGKLGGELKIRNGSLYQKLSDQIGSFEGNPLFPTCQVRLLDFIRDVLLILLLLLLRLLLFLLLQFLLDHVCINFHVHFRLANSSRISSPTSANSGHCWTSTAGFRSEWARLDLNRRVLSAVGTAGPQPPGSERSGHRWTSTAGFRAQWAPLDHPGTFRAQWAPLDLNLGPSELSGRPDRMPEDMPDRTPDRMSERMPEDIPDKMPEDMPDRMPDRMPEGMPDRMPEGMPDKVPECLPDRTPEDLPDRMPEDMPEDMPDRVPEDMPEDMPDRVPEDMPEHMPEDMPDRMPDRMPEDMPDKMPEDMSDRMPEDLPVTKRINVMVGITRSKVFFLGMHRAAPRSRQEYGDEGAW